MSSKITAIKTQNSSDKEESDIISVKLSDGTIETVAQVVRFIDTNYDYYFTSSNGSNTEVESVHPNYSDPYIRTKPNQTTSDNLLSLPRF